MDYSSLYKAVRMARKGVAQNTLKYLLEQTIYFKNYECAKWTVELMGRGLTRSEVEQLMINELKDPCGEIMALSIAKEERDKISKRMLDLLMAHAIDTNFLLIAEETAELLGRTLYTEEVDRLLLKDIAEGRSGLSGAIFTAQAGEKASKKVLELLLRKYKELMISEGDIWKDHLVLTQIMLKEAR